MSELEITERQVWEKPELINKWCELKSIQLSIPRQETGKLAVEKFGSNHPWSDKKVRYLLDQRYKQIYRANNARMKYENVSDNKEIKKITDILEKELKKKDPEQNKPSLLKLAETIYEVTRFVKNK